MSIETAFFTYLSSKSAITDLVGTNIWKGHLPQSYATADVWTSPAITFSKVSEVHDHNLDGGSGCARARIQVDCWASTAAVAENIAEQIRLVLQGYAGSIGSVTATSVILDNVLSLPEPPVDGSSKWRYHEICDFLVIYRESKPQFSVTVSAFSSAFSSAFRGRT